MSKTINEITEIAANWWGDVICNPKFDNGDSGSTGGLGMMLALMNTKPVENETKQKFIKELQERIIKQLQIEIDKGYGRKQMIISVDYHPDQILNDCAIIAGINSNNFPWKTTMWISTNVVCVRYGYSAPNKYLYSNKEYWSSKIKDTEESIEEYKGENSLYWMKDEEEKKKRRKEYIEQCEKDIIKYKEELEKAEE